MIMQYSKSSLKTTASAFVGKEPTMTTFSPILLLWYVFPIIVLFASVFLVSALSLNRKGRTWLFLFCGLGCISSLKLPSHCPFYLI